MPQRFTASQRARLNQSFLGSAGTIATSQIARDAGLPVTAVDTTSFLTVFAATGSSWRAYWGAWVDSKTTGTAGGSFSNGAWRTRDLNTELANNISGASLASNQVTLPAGTYLCLFSAPAHKVDSHTTRLYNVTGSATLLSGSTVKSSSSGSNASTVSSGFGIFTLAVASVVELQHQGAATEASDGFGLANSFGDPEIYGQVMVLKVA